MIRFIGDIVGSEILLFQEHSRLGPVLKMIFSPYNGSVLGLVCFDPIQKKSKVIGTADIKKMTDRIIIINSYDSLAEPGDIVRIAEAINIGAPIIGERVVTESGKALGKVVNATIDVMAWRLARLYVNPPLSFNLLGRELLIPAKQIIKIEKKRIIVSDATVKEKQAVGIHVTSNLAEC